MDTANKRQSKRVGLYARVSTDDKGQDPELQLVPLRRYAELRGWTITKEYVDLASGVHEKRPEYQKLRKDARARRLDVVLVWRFDRFARSTHTLVNALTEFRSLGVDFFSEQEQIDTTTPAGEAMFAMAAAFAQFESSLIRSRVREGMANAKRKGKQIGNPGLSEAVIEQLRAAFERSAGVRATARELNLSPGAVSKYFRRFREEK